MSQPDQQVAEISQLLDTIEHPGDIDEYDRPILPRAQENELLQVRMGVASSLFAALRSKHEPTAQHCLRVSLGCSAWAARIGVPEQQRDEIELAALLHDLGKVSVPDALLRKPGPLTLQEMAIMEEHWAAGQEILRCSCASAGVLDNIRYARSWYDGSRHRLQFFGDDI
ncbi:MAG TPA: HD domain-containing phosphohydrolase, partial [Pirellulales bacterium]|nr:HD domain-containing phosphohydrolase [Pirellulales bacterium]